MQCPRCGHQAEGMARACPACGYILPFSLRQLHQQRNTAGAALNDISAPRERDLASAAGPPLGHAPATPNALGAAGTQTDSAGWLSPLRASPSGRLTGPLRLEPTNDATRPHTSELPAVGSGTGRHEVLSLVPAFPPALDVPSEAQLTTTSMLAALGAGALLKSGRYRLVKRFSAGVSYGRRGEAEPPLYMASDLERPGRRVLVQELPLAEADVGVAERAHQQAAARLRAVASRGAAPQLLDAFNERGRRFLVFELPAGEQLSDILRRSGPAADEDLIQLGLGLLEAEAVLWNVTPPVVHGNLSPDNVLVRPDGELAFVGFSPTLLVQAVAPMDHGAAGGVRGYAAPEQQRGQADVRSDLYAIAAMLHQAATGKRPSGTLTATSSSVRTLNPAVSPELDELLSRALRPAPAQRVGTVDEFRTGLLALLPPGARPTAHVSGGLAPRVGGRPMHTALPEPLAALRATLEQPAVHPTARSRTLRVILATLVLLAIVATGALYVLRSHAPTSMPPVQPTVDATASALYSQANIGVSDGREIFDTTRSDTPLKRQAAAALLRGDMHTAYQLFQQASAAGPGDVEAAIYAEDARIAVAGAPAVSLVVGTSFGDSTSPTDSLLRGVLLAQLQVNSLDLLPGITQLRVLLANAGADPSGAAQAAQLVARGATAASAHVLGVVGWPDAARTRAALAALGTLPYVLPGSAVDGVSGPGYFALGPSDAQQGATLASAISTLHGHGVFVLVDPADARGVALANAFVMAQKAASGTFYITRQETLVGTQASAFTQPALDALYSGSNTILVAGGAADVVNVARVLAQQAPWALGQVRILAPTWAYTPSLLGVGSDATADIVRADPAALRDVTVASLAAADEWTAAGVGEGRQPQFFADYSTRFGTVPSPSGLPEPDASVILGYDATQLLATAANKAATATREPDASGVRAALAALRPGAGVQGVGGAIAFDGSGAPASRALALLNLVPAASVPAGSPALVPVTTAIAGGTSAFCLASGCSAG